MATISGPCGRHADPTKLSADLTSSRTLNDTISFLPATSLCLCRYPNHHLSHYWCYLSFPARKIHPIFARTVKLQAAHSILALSSSFSRASFQISAAVTPNSLFCNCREHLPASRGFLSSCQYSLHRNSALRPLS